MRRSLSTLSSTSSSSSSSSTTSTSRSTPSPAQRRRIRRRKEQQRNTSSTTNTRSTPVEVIVYPEQTLQENHQPQQQQPRRLPVMNATVSGESVLKLLSIYIGRFADSFKSGARILSLNALSIRYINARLREWKRKEEEYRARRKGLLRNLWSLIDSNTAITSHDFEMLHDFFAHLPKLLVQGNGSDTEIDLSFFTSLVELDIHNCNVVWVKGGKSIRRLNLMRTGVDVDKFTNVRFVSLKKSPRVAWKTITEVIETIETIQCEDGSIQSLKDLLETDYKLVWKNLRRLDCQSNGLTMVDNCLKYAPALEQLLLANNDIKTIPYLETCNELLLADLSNNLLRNVKEIGNFFVKLRILNLSHNKLNTMEGIETIYTLENLDLSHNRISEWSEIKRISKLPDLESLKLHGNKKLMVYKYYREFACGFFTQKSHFAFDNKPASRWELNSHQHLKLSSSDSSDSNLSPHERSSSPRSLLHSQLRGLVPTPVIMATPAKETPKKAKKKKLTKKTKKKALKRSVDEFPEFVLNNEEDADDEREVSKPIDIVHGDSVDNNNNNIANNLLDNNSYFERMAHNFIDDKEENSSVSLDESINSALSAASSLDGGTKMRERLEALKKDGGDQWLIILNDYLEHTPSDKQKPRAALNAFQKALSDLDRKETDNDTPTKLDNEAEQFLQKARERNKRRLQDRKLQERLLATDEYVQNDDNSKPTSSIVRDEESTSATSSPESPSSISQKGANQTSKPHKTTIKKYSSKDGKSKIIVPRKIIRVDETKDDNDKSISQPGKSQDIDESKDHIQPESIKEGPKTEVERKRRLALKTSDREFTQLLNIPSSSSSSRKDEQTDNQTYQNTPQEELDNSKNSSASPSTRTDAEDNNLLIESMLGATKNVESQEELDNSESSSSKHEAIADNKIDISNNVSYVDTTSTANAVRDTSVNIDIDQLLERDEDDIDLDELDMQFSRTEPFEDEPLSKSDNKKHSTEEKQHQHPISAVTDDFSSFSHLTPHIEDIMTSNASATHMDDQRKGEELDVQGDHWQLHTALNVFLSKEEEELHFVTYSNFRSAKDNSQSSQFPIENERSIALVFSNHRLYLLADDKDQNQPLSTFQHVEYESIRHIHVGFQYQCLHFETQNEQKLLLLPRDAHTCKLIIQQIVRHVPNANNIGLTHYDDKFLKMWKRFMAESSYLYDTDEDEDDFIFSDDDDDSNDAKSDDGKDEEEKKGSIMEGYFMVYLKDDTDDTTNAVPQITFPSRVVGPLMPHALCFTEKHIFICEERIDGWPSSLVDESTPYFAIAHRELMSDLSYVEVLANDSTDCELVMVFDRDGDTTSCTWCVALQQPSTREVVISKLSCTWHRLFGIEISVRRPIEGAENVTREGGSLPSSPALDELEGDLKWAKPTEIVGRKRRGFGKHVAGSVQHNLTGMRGGRSRQPSATSRSFR